ncbi:MAG: helix-turn-helix domain-containing protein [Christensenellales bacterium]
MSDYDFSGVQSAFFLPMPLGQWASLFSVLELFPAPMEVFAADGLSLFVNKEFLNFFHIDDVKEIVGKFNILSDSYINGAMGLAEYLRRVFSGEILSLSDMRVPAEEFANRYKGDKSRLMESDIYQDITCFPLRDENGAVACVVALFMMKRVYQARLDTLKAKAYIEAHWLDDFNRDKIAEAANLSADHLTRLFKKFTGKTPYSYYQECKLEKIKETLCDRNLSIGEAFAACGTDYNGRFAEAFKRTVGMTPTQYRKSLTARSQEYPHDTAERKKPVARPESFPAYSSIPVCKTESQLFRIAELLPIPMQIFKQNGDILFVNEAVLKAWNVQDSSRILGNYNLIRDPLVNEQFGLREQIRKTFQGEVILISDIRLPLESFWKLYNARTDDHDIEAIYTDILNFTVWVEDVGAAYVVSLFLTSRRYQGRSSVTKAKEYLENHWKEDFDAVKLAQAVCLSPSHLARQFKKKIGMTLYSYYQEIKINRLKAALRDQNLSIAEAFDACGLEYNGSIAGLFKEKVGVTPSQYRKTLKE